MSDPILLQLPSAQAAYQRKYTALGPVLSGLDPGLASALQQYDLARVNRGVAPLGLPDTQRLLWSSANNAQATPAPGPAHHGILGTLGSIVGNVGGDVRDITASLPRLPMALVHEAKALPELPQALAQASSLQDITRAPGVRLIPGAYTLGNVATGDWQSIEQHPLMTALDVLPVAKELAPGLAQTALGEAATQGLSRARQAVSRTAPGLYASMAWGGESRRLSALANLEDQTLRSEFTPGAQGDELTSLASRAAEFGQQFKSIPVDRRVELTGLMERDPRALSDMVLNDDERGFVEQGRHLSDELGRYNLSQGLLSEVNGELYTPQAASRLLQLRSARDAAAQFNEVRNHVTNPSGNVDELIQNSRAIANDNNLSKSTQASLLRGYAHALDANGYDSSNLLSAIRGVERQAGADWSSVVSHLDDGVPASPLTPVNDIIDTLGVRATDPTVARLADHVARGNWSAANDMVKTLERRKVYTLDQLDDIKSSVNRYRLQQQWLDKISKYNDAAVARANKSYDSAVAATAPDRFQSYVQDQTKQRLLERYSTDPNFDAISKFVEQGYYKGVPGLADEAGQLSKEIASTWQDLKANGIDPVFIHRVTPTGAQSLDYPHISDAIRTPSQLQARTNDISPYVHDATVAIPHQGLELLTRRRTEHFVNEVMKSAEEGGWGASRDDLLQQYLPAAERIAQRNPQLDTLGVAEQLMRREYEAFDPTSIVTWKGAKLSNYSDQVLVPKAVARNMQLMFHPPLAKLTALLDPAMKLYRTSLLPLSPRWHFNNILGNMAMAATEDPRILARLGEAKKIIDAGETPQGIGAGLGMGQAPREFVEWDRTTKSLVPRALDLMDQYHFQGGQTLRRIYDEVTTKGQNIVSKSYNFNALVDDMHRVAAYLTGKDNALKAGMSSTESQAAGVALARKVFMKWDEMTPIERSVMRAVFPFYGWCVDRETEALTKRGWVKGEDISTDDEVLSMTPTGEMVWSPVHEVFRDWYVGDMVKMEHRHLDALVTPGHKFALTDGSLVPVEELRERHVLRLMGSAEQSSLSTYSDAFVEVVGWAVTEGHYKKGRSGNCTTIEISQKDSSPECESIRASIKLAGGNWHEFLAGVDHRIRYFGVTGQLAQQIQAVAPHRVMAPQFLLALSMYQRQLLLDVMLRADGSQAHRGRHDPWVFAQKDPQAVDAFLMLTSLLGIVTSTKLDNGCHRITLRSKTVAEVRKIKNRVSLSPPHPARMPTEFYDGPVWCPRTDHGTFVCRRRGKVYVTGNTSHVLRYVSRYPFDHPARAAIAGSFARNEVEDQRAGLGSKWLSSFFLGHPDEKGMIKSISLSGVNPFRDVANYMTLAGFVGSANPVAQIVLERMGIDPSTGQADLYPELTYDANTGRLTAKKADLLSSVVSNFVPQANVVLGMLGANTDFKQLARTNPDAAGNLLRSQLGLPIVFRNVPLYQEEFKTEMARHQAQQIALSQALKTGNWTDAERYPGVSAYLDQIRKLQSSGQLAAYVPKSQGGEAPDTPTLLEQAVLAKNTP